jgi:hypothetical protein
MVINGHIIVCYWAAAAPAHEAAAIPPRIRNRILDRLTARQAAIDLPNTACTATPIGGRHSSRTARRGGPAETRSGKPRSELQGGPGTRRPRQRPPSRLAPWNLHSFFLLRGSLCNHELLHRTGDERSRRTGDELALVRTPVEVPATERAETTFQAAVRTTIPN